ncbi:protein-L-isoaspartate(D-aspartate) O-methyltransferase [Salinisphaera sp. LB1]|uniref:protein-L-isoaspartate(D-aspartate) O-methyltransferase n=1 Tax=Salinisphaera sp. LB1 TaxID=2183911 RepID=UPI000D706CAA|nr:protein-L-isoaspartate(D-aspartate) O-methyltransferase [Salinisphaera sp. LB1]AWN17061.1 Protein-L-isoaspartate O-methyltransferase [Salinisphaera sp. LB1]
MIDPDKHPHVRGFGMASARSRARLIARLEQLGIRDERVLAAMNRVPRHMFVDEAMTSRAYDDTALPIGYGQTISQPYIVAQMTSLLLADGVPDHVLEIGTGSGYQAAVLAELVDTVYTVERIKPLYDQARRRFAELGYRNIRAREAREDVLGLPSYGPFDVILVTAGAEALPTSLCAQMAEQGRMIVPVGDTSGAGQRLVVVRRQGQSFQREDLDPVSFVPLIEGHD